MESKHSRTGFFGKLASQGDFVSRRLSPAFVRQWDDWLQAGLVTSRDRLGHQWLDAYLCSPIWHFALAAGVCGEIAWSGVLMPSVDRVGRHFPLTIAYGVPSVRVDQRLRCDAAWYTELEKLALSSLENGFSLALFDAALSVLPQPSPTPVDTLCAQPGIGVPPLWLERPADEPMDHAISHWLSLLERVLSGRPWAGHSLFWTEGSAQQPPTLALSPGLPSAQTFVDMLAGRGRGKP
jgi:type VI secretion system protein ImpM